jgi:hypothetical protein
MLNMLENWFLPQLNNTVVITCCNQTELPTIFIRMTESFSIGFLYSVGSEVLQIETTIFLSFFLWGFLKDCVYVSPLPMPIQKLRDRISQALQDTTTDMLYSVWNEFDYRVDKLKVCN